MKTNLKKVLAMIVVAGGVSSIGLNSFAYDFEANTAPPEPNYAATTKAARNRVCAWIKNQELTGQGEVDVKNLCMTPVTAALGSVQYSDQLQALIQSVGRLADDTHLLVGGSFKVKDKLFITNMVIDLVDIQTILVSGSLGTVGRNQAIAEAFSTPARNP
jgi:hypothetical protein